MLLSLVTFKATSAFNLEPTTALTKIKQAHKFEVNLILSVWHKMVILDTFLNVFIPCFFLWCTQVDYLSSLLNSCTEFCKFSVLLSFCLQNVYSFLLKVLCPFTCFKRESSWCNSCICGTLWWQRFDKQWLFFVMYEANICCCCNCCDLAFTSAAKTSIFTPQCSSGRLIPVSLCNLSWLVQQYLNMTQIFTLLQELWDWGYWSWSWGKRWETRLAVGEKTRNDSAANRFPGIEAERLRTYCSSPAPLSVHGGMEVFNI